MLCAGFGTAKKSHLSGMPICYLGAVPAAQAEWSLCFEDRPRLEAVLGGVDSWSERPSAFRRCYQGLAKSYFTYDAFGDNAPATARNNWKLLREYLHDKNGLIKDRQVNPDWVATAIGNRQLFGETPCAPYVDELLRGDASAIDHLCEELGIAKASWFLRELVLAQIRGATQLSDSQFKGLLPRMLELLANNDVLRDRGLVMLLDRYVKVPGMHLQQNLRDWSVLWWGNPWLPPMKPVGVASCPKHGRWSPIGSN